MSLRDLTVPELFARAISGDRRALGRSLTLVERGGGEAEELAELTHSGAGNAHVIGITGAPGSGKSTLTGKLIGIIGEAGYKPAVLAVDPSSPLTGGAILGDRVRMDEEATPDTFIRSMATRGHQGGLALAVPGAIRMLDAAGYNPVIVETVGVGQVEVDVAGTADTTLVVLAPGMGDAVQANKAGLLEVADVFVVNKADRPGANDVRRDLDLMLDLSDMTGQVEAEFRPEILMTSAISGEGAEVVWEALGRHLTLLVDNDLLGDRRSSRDRAEVLNRVEQLLAARAEQHLDTAEAKALLKGVADRAYSPAKAASGLVDGILGYQSSSA